MPSTELTSISLAKTKLLTRSAVLVRDVRGIRLPSKTTNNEVSSIGKYGHGGSEIYRWWGQKAVKFMLRMSTGHKLANHGKFFPCSIFLLRMILHPISHYKTSIIWKMGTLQDMNGYCPAKRASMIGMRVLCEGRSRALCRWRYRFDLPSMPHEKKLKIESCVEQQRQRIVGKKPFVPSAWEFPVQSNK